VGPSVAAGSQQKPTNHKQKKSGGKKHSKVIPAQQATMGT